jgi:hypothetical protein
VGDDPAIAFSDILTGTPISDLVASSIAPRLAPMLMALVTNSKTTMLCSSRPRIVTTDVAGAAPAGHSCADPGADLLARDHQRQGE